MTYRYARDRALTLLMQGAYIEKRIAPSHTSKAKMQDVYYLVWSEQVNDAGLMLTKERWMWRKTFFRLLEDKTIKPVPETSEHHRRSEYMDVRFTVVPTKWVLNK